MPSPDCFYLRSAGTPHCLTEHQQLNPPTARTALAETLGLPPDATEGTISQYDAVTTLIFSNLDGLKQCVGSEEYRLLAEDGAQMAENTLIMAADENVVLENPGKSIA